MSNILYDKKVRSKFTNLFNFLTFNDYYQLDNIPLKQKLYMFWYNMEKKGYTTEGESDFVLNIDCKYPELYRSIRAEYDKDFIEYSQNPNKL